MSGSAANAICNAFTTGEIVESNIIKETARQSTIFVRGSR